MNETVEYPAVTDTMRKLCIQGFTFHGENGYNVLMIVREFITLINKHGAEINVKQLFEIEKEKLYSIFKMYKTEFIKTYILMFASEEKITNVIYYLISDIAWFYNYTI
jgi:hypothetical protein